MIQNGEHGGIYVYIDIIDMTTTSRPLNWYMTDVFVPSERVGSRQSLGALYYSTSERFHSHYAKKYDGTRCVEY